MTNKGDTFIKRCDAGNCTCTIFVWTGVKFSQHLFIGENPIAI